MDLLATLTAIDEFDDMLHTAKLVPLSDRARMKPEVLSAAVARIREGCESVLTGRIGQRTRHSVAKLEAAARDAKPVRVLGGVGVDKDAVYDVLDELRANLAHDLRQEGPEPPEPPEHLAAIDAIDDLVRSAATIPYVEMFSDQARIDPIAFRAALDRVGAADLPPTARPVLDRLTAVFEAAKGVPFSPYVRADREELSELIDELRAASAGSEGT